VTEATERQFREDVSALGALPPTIEPRATQYIDTMRVMIERLIARGVAYVAEDHVLFSPNAMDALPWAPRYGTLAHRSLDEMLAGARVDVAPYKRDPMDFVLWKPSKPNEPGWPSPAGIGALGRPGWHIECSAMSMATLLEPFGGGLQCDDPSRNTFDIHGGGIDLVFPHHENEIAQSCTAFHSSRMANVWMHNGFLQVEGEKMSKSLGNFVTIHELLETGKFGNSTWPGDVLRLAMLRTHYRQPIDWTVKELERAQKDLREWYDLANSDVSSDGAVDPGVIDALCDDLNTHNAIVRLNELAGAGNFAALRASLRFFGFSCDPSKLARRVSVTVSISGPSTVSAVGSVSVSASNSGSPIIETRSESEPARRFTLDAEPPHFSTAPRTATVFVVRGDGTIETDPSTQRFIDDRIARRNAARAAKNFAEADRIRDELASLGVAIKDNKNGATTWEPKR
jgi:cysteinyl-tRNA synthetase